MRKFKKLTSVFMAVIMTFFMLLSLPITVNAAENNSYRDSFIKALLESNDVIWDGSVVIKFVDLNFDGNLEFITQFGDNGYSLSTTAPTAVYYYKNNKIVKAPSWCSVNDSLTGYYNKTDNKYLLLQSSKGFPNGGHKVNDWDLENYILKFNGSDVFENVYSSRKHRYNTANKTETNYYYDGGLYENKSPNLISKKQYDNINNKVIENCVNINMQSKKIYYTDFYKYSYSQKKKALEDSYNAFSYTKYGATSVKLNRSTLTLGVGERYGLIKTVSPSSANQSCTWSSSNSSIASVDSNGKVTAKKSGWANITVKTSNGKTATCKVTVKPAPTSVKINPASLTLGKGETYTISQSTNSGSYAWGFSWSSSNTSVATVKKGSANKATVTAKGVGTATITIKTYNGKTATCKVTVKNAPTSVKTTPTSVTLGKGEKYTISESTNSGTYANATNLKWSTTNSNVATVTKGSANKATITAKGNGTAYIKITLYNGKTAQCKVTVKNAPTSIKLSKSFLVVAQGKTATISENTPNAYANAANLVWSSSDNNIVEIKKVAGINKAEIKAKNKGTTKITVKTYNGKKAECTVQVFGTTTKTVTLSFNSLDSWKNEINKKERELVFGGNFATNPAGDQYYTGNTITNKQVLEYKTITAKVSLNTPGYYQTVKYKLPSKIKYTMHKHQMEKGYGTSWYIGAGSGTIVFNNNCNCGFHNEWSWEIPLLENNMETPPDIGNGIEVVVYPKNGK